MGENIVDPSGGAGEGSEEKRGRGRPRNPPAEGTGATAGGTQAGGEEGGTSPEGIEIVGELVPGLIPTPEPEVKRGRGRPPGSGKSTTAKAGKNSVKVADKETTQNMVNTLLTVAFGITSSRFGSHWMLTPQESAALSEPIGSILDRMGMTEVTGKYADYIALGTALIAIIVPRVIMSMNMSKQKGGIQLVQSTPKPVPTATAGTAPSADGNASPPTGGNKPIRGAGSGNGPASIKQSLAWTGG